jgi:hypothetical protein
MREDWPRAKIPLHPRPTPDAAPPEITARADRGSSPVSPGKEAVGVRIIGGSQDLGRTDIVRRRDEASLDWVEGDPVLAPEQLARPRLQAEIIEAPGRRNAGPGDRASVRSSRLPTRES